MLGLPAEAEEVVQDVFVKAITRVEQYDGSAPVASWLFAIAANACRDRLRRTRRAGLVPFDGIADPGDGTLPEDDRLVHEERRTMVREALQHLSREQREVLVLARYHGMPYAEIARTLGISEGAVKTRVFRALETLRTRLTSGVPRWTAATH
jgi:RNA polymerase sigma-70 factor (ECF subfamily)